MEIKPLQRISQEGDVALFQGYHSYAVKTSPVTPPLDYEEESFPDSKSPAKPSSPEPKDDVKTVEHKPEHQKRGGTPVPSHEPVHEEKKPLKAEPKPESKHPPPPPEHKVEEKIEAPVEKKTETKVVAKIEPKAVVKKAPPPEAAAKEVEEHEEVMLHGRGWGVEGVRKQQTQPPKYPISLMRHHIISMCKYLGECVNAQHLHI
ncbi:hypothetical protein lerEdw1_002001 [Lerista edwardsae]|nr:hypothetical protein lerEdw1_002001 [Lerista edwardsae]